MSFHTVIFDGFGYMFVVILSNKFILYVGIFSNVESSQHMYQRPKSN